MSDTKLPSESKLPPKTKWSQLPTPVQKLERMSEFLGVELWVKRDDLTGFETSGNKIRKLEYLFHDARAKGANTVITCGGVQSNHCRATAALAAKLGMRSVLLLRGEEPKQWKANFLLDKIFGAEILFVTEKQYYEEIGEIRLMLEQQIRAQGGKSYFIPEGGSNGIGCMGYLEAYEEIESQRANGLFGSPEPLDSIVLANGSGGTQAGLILGKLKNLKNNEHTRIVGVNVCYDSKETFRRVKDALWQSIQVSHLPLSFMSEDIEILDGFLGLGYAKSTKEERLWIQRMANLEGILFDPVYTGKAFTGLAETVKKDPKRLGKRILFLHTGGGFGNFSAEEQWKESLSS